MKEILFQPKLISLSGDLENVPLRLPAPGASLTEVPLLCSAGRHWSVPGRSKTSLKANFGSWSLLQFCRNFQRLHSSLAHVYPIFLLFLLHLGTDLGQPQVGACQGHLPGSQVALCWAQLLSHVRLFATPWTAARQTPLSMRFSRQEYWSRSPCPPSGELPDPGIEPRSPASGKESTCQCRRHESLGFDPWVRKSP